MKVIAKGRRTPLNGTGKFPELAMVLDGVFGTNGMESHPKLSDDVLYKAKSNSMIMTKARENLLAPAPNIFNVFSIVLLQLHPVVHFITKISF